MLTRRRLAVLYGGAAVLLVPWIVVLAVIQPRHGVNNHVDLTRGSMSAVIIALCLLVALLPRWAEVSGPATTTFALLTAWFSALTATREISAALVRAGVLALLLTAGAAAWTTLAVRHGRRRAGRAGRILLVLLAGAIAAFVIRTLDRTPSVVRVGHLKAVWVGLDIAELVSLAALSWALWKRAAWVSPVGATTAALLSLDALVNITSSTGAGQAQAVLMGLVELPLAVSALVVAVRYADPEAAAARLVTATSSATKSGQSARGRS